MMLKRTAKSCGPDAPMPASSLREEARATVSNKPGHREEREVSRKTIARGMPGDSGVTVVTMLVCFFYLHARLRTHLAPGILCALYCRRGERIFANLGRIAPRDRGVVCEIRHPEVRALRCTCTAGRASKDGRPGRRPSRRIAFAMLLRMTGIGCLKI